jgi:hypothetical protein
MLSIELDLRRVSFAVAIREGGGGTIIMGPTFAGVSPLRGLNTPDGVYAASPMRDFVDRVGVRIGELCVRSISAFGGVGVSNMVRPATTRNFLTICSPPAASERRLLLDCGIGSVPSVTLALFRSCSTDAGADDVAWGASRLAHVRAVDGVLVDVVVVCCVDGSRVRVLAAELTVTWASFHTSGRDGGRLRAATGDRLAVVAL